MRLEEPHVVYVPDLDAEARDTSAPASTTVGISADQRFRRIAGLLVVLDVLCLAGALVAAHGLRFGFLPGGVHLIAAVVVASVLWVGVFHALGLYRPDHLSRPEEFRRTISAVGIGIVLIIVLTFWFEVYLSRSWIALTFLIAIVTELMARGFVRAHVARLKARGSLVLRTVVVGSGEYATDLAQALDADGSGFRSIAHIDAGDPLLPLMSCRASNVSSGFELSFAITRPTACSSHRRRSARARCSRWSRRHGRKVSLIRVYTPCPGSCRLGSPRNRSGRLVWPSRCDRPSFPRCSAW